MDNKLNNMINDFIENSGATNEEELNKALQEFMKKYNGGELEYENTPLDDAYDLLEQASNAKSEKEAIKLAKKAYETSNECFDAIIFLANLEENTLKQEQILKDGLKKEKEHLKSEGYFSKENIGHFYGIFETRPYIRGLYTKALHYAENGQIKLMVDTCKEILRLNENDNTGARYLLMAGYAWLEDEKPMLSLYRKYKEEHLEMLFPLLAIYYKQGNYKEAKKYLEKINESNPHFKKLFDGTLKDDGEFMKYQSYSKGKVSEVIMYVNTYTFLLDSMPNLTDFISQK